MLSAAVLCSLQQTCSIRLLCKYLEGAADDSTHMHTARYATADNREGVCLCADLQHTENVSCAFDWCLN